MFDYSNWIKEAELFVNRVAQLRSEFEEVEAASSVQQPLDESTLRHIVARVDSHVPAELQNFWRQATRRCDCRYVCRDAKGEMAERVKQIFSYEENIYGGACFFDPIELPKHLSSCKEWAKINSEEPEQEALWLNVLPFSAILNGDYLGLEVSEAQDNPPVVYLAHDDESRVIAPSFTSFLQTWAALFYIGPESWMLEPFLNEKGMIDTTSPRAALWREVFDRE